MGRDVWDAFRAETERRRPVEQSCAWRQAGRVASPLRSHEAYSTIIVGCVAATVDQLEAPRRTKEMSMTYSQRPRCLPGFRKGVAPAVSSMIAVLIWSGLVSPVGGEDRVAVPPYDRAVLSEIAQDVLRRGSTGRNQSVPESTSPGADAKEEMAVVGSAPDPASARDAHRPRARGHTASRFRPRPRRQRRSFRRRRPPAINPTRGGSALTPRARSASRRASSPRRPGSTPR